LRHEALDRFGLSQIEFSPGRADDAAVFALKPAHDGRVLIEVDPRYFRPTETDALLGDPSKARQRLGWQHKVKFDELVREMVEADLAELRRDGSHHNTHD